MLSQSRICVGLFSVLLLAGCVDKFKQEAALEEVSVRLARQADTFGYGLITTEELAQRLEKGKELLVVDVRTERDFLRGHIPGALNFTFPKGVLMEESWDKGLMEGKSEKAFAALLGPETDRVLVFSCGRTRCERGHNAALWAVRLGYQRVLRHPGGIEAWQGRGLPIE